MNFDQHPVQVRGKQRIAVYNALKHPATGRQILDLARQTAPSMTYQDLRHILRDFQKLGFVVCLNPECQTGRLYVLDSVRRKSPSNMEHIRLCARLGRAKNRLAVLEEVARDRYADTQPLTASRIRKRLRETHSLGLNHVLAALKFLETNGLVETAGRTEKRDLKIYQVTELGKTILHQLLLPKKLFDDDSSPTR